MTALSREFERMAGHEFGHMHSWDLFKEWLNGAWWLLSGGMEADSDNRRERLDKFTKKQGEALGTLFHAYVDMVEQRPFDDVLGETLIELDLASVRAGQYFTPMPICRMTAEMNFSEEALRAKADSGEKLTVCDPACGSGAMLLAMGGVITNRMGREWLRHVEFYGMDIDERCCLMARIQIRLNGMDSIGRCAAMLGAMDDVAPVVLDDPVCECDTVAEVGELKQLQLF